MLTRDHHPHAARLLLATAAVLLAGLLLAAAAPGELQAERPDGEAAAGRWTGFVAAGVPRRVARRP